MTTVATTGQEPTQAQGQGQAQGQAQAQAPAQGQAQAQAPVNDASILGGPSGQRSQAEAERHAAAAGDAAALAASASASASARRPTLARFRRQLVVTDVVMLVTAVATAHVVRFPGDFGLPGAAGLSGGLGIARPLGVDTVLGWAAACVAAGTALVAVWMVALARARTRDPRIIGVGNDEYRRMLTASLVTIAVVAVLAYAFRVDLPRGYVAVAFPVGLVLLCIGRKAWRGRLAACRAAGELLTDVLLVGEHDDVRYVGAKIAATPAAGYRVRAVATDAVQPGERIACGAALLDVEGCPDDVVEIARRSDVGAVVLAGPVAGGHERLRRLGWELEELGVELVVSSPLVDVAEARVHPRPVDGLPLMHVETPEYQRRRVGKRVLDIVGAAAGLVLLAPVLAVVALAIRIEDGGPVFFRQVRVGRGGAPFQILKFRSMHVDAEARVADLVRLDEGAGPLFKIRNDPRVTRVGAFLRRTSLDELPQLWNVLVGTMSLVGPRPALPNEVARYADHADRRLLVTPGITGLWQVSGRSDLDWAEGVRLDLHYVENWSFLHDLVILGRTVPSVLRSRGAY